MTAPAVEEVQVGLYTVEVVKEIETKNFGTVSVTFQVPQHHDLASQIEYYHGEEKLCERLNGITARMALSQATLNKIAESKAEDKEAFTKEISDTVEKVETYTPRAGGLSVAKAGKNAQDLIALAEDPERAEEFEALSKEELVAKLKNMFTD